MLTNDKSFPMLMLNVTCKSVTPAQTAKHLPDRWSRLPPRAQEEHRDAGSSITQPRHLSLDVRPTALLSDNG